MKTYHCYFCNELSNEIVCDKPQCRSQDVELREWNREEEEKMILAGIRNAFIERAKCEDDYCLNRAQRWFYVFKCIVCVLFKRARPVSAERYHDVVKVSTIYFNGQQPSWEAAWMQVGHGIFKQWWFDILKDGDSSY